MTISSKPSAISCSRGGPPADDHAHAEVFELRTIGAHHVGIVGLAGNACGKVHLSADLRGGLEHDDLVAAPGRLDGADQPGNACADDGDALLARRRGGA